MNLPDTLEVEVDGQVIDEAAAQCLLTDLKCIVNDCAIALAVKRKYPEWNWAMGYTTLVGRSGPGVEEYVCSTSSEFVEQFMEYLHGNASRPDASSFTFTRKGQTCE